MSTELGTAYISILPSTKGLASAITSELNSSSITNAAKNIGSSIGGHIVDGIKAAGTGIKNAMVDVIKIGAEGAKTAAQGIVTGIKELTVGAIDQYKDYEQLTGGIKKLFNETTLGLGDYADALGVDAREVIGDWMQMTEAGRLVTNNASEAFKTAGMSANEYMETVTGFSASLINSLEGDTVTAANLADIAIRDMSDNANTYGTNMDSIKAAYAGFAKQNYTMLDNLKLGYGGTAAEMMKLLNDSGVLEEQLTDVEQVADVGFATIVQAIHAIQEGQGIVGTTVNEAMSTISGSITMLKASWTNFLTSLADESGSLGNTVDAVSDSLEAVLNNFGKILPVILDGISYMIPKLLPKVLEQVKLFIETLAAAIPDVIPPLVGAVKDCLNIIVQALPEILPTLINAVVEIVVAIAEIMPTLIPTLAAATVQLFTALVDALPRILPALIEATTVLIVEAIRLIPQFIPLLLQAAIELFMAICQAVGSILGELTGDLGALIDTACADVAGGAGEMLAAAGEFFLQILTAITQAVPNILGFVASIPGAIVNALGDLGGLLWNAGTSIIGGFLGGLQSAFGGVMDFVSGVAGWIYENKGPLTYDAKLLVKNGNVIMEGLETGLREGFADVQRFVLDANNIIQNGITGNTTVTTNARSMVGETATGASVSIKNCTFNVRKDDDITAIANAIGSMVTRTNSARLAGVMA